MSKSIKHYSEELKLSLIRSYYESGQSKGKFCKKHALCDTSLLNYWLKTYENSKEMLPLRSEAKSDDDMSNRSKDSYREEVHELKKRIRELEKALDYSKLETLARDLMIDKAEEYFEISIRKNLGPSSVRTGQRARAENLGRLQAV